MSNLLKNTSILFIALASLGSCKRDFLNTQPLGQIPAGATWKDKGLAQAFVTNVYNGLGNGGFDEQELDRTALVTPDRIVLAIAKKDGLGKAFKEWAFGDGKSYSAEHDPGVMYWPPFIYDEELKQYFCGWSHNSA